MQLKILKSGLILENSYKYCFSLENYRRVYFLKKTWSILWCLARYCLNLDGLILLLIC